MKSKNKKVSFPIVSLTPEQANTANGLADKLGVSKSAALRMAVFALLKNKEQAATMVGRAFANCTPFTNVYLDEPQASDLRKWITDYDVTVSQAVRIGLELLTSGQKEV